MLTQAQLKSRLSYDPRNGVFTWLTSSRGKRDIGKQAGVFDASNGGRIRIFIEGKRYYASHLAFLYMTGEWPSTPQMDHRNLNAADNRWTNIRPATSSQNFGNRRVRMDSRTGFKGIKPVGFRFRARINVNGKSIHLGYFATEVEAHEAYVTAAIKYYGEFANFG